MKKSEIEQVMSGRVRQAAEESLSVTCAIGAGFGAKPKGGRLAGPIVEAFIARAESGKDKDAALLNMMEGDVSNGGFLQLYENKGERFIREAVALLRSTGSMPSSGASRRTSRPSTSRTDGNGRDMLDSGPDGLVNRADPQRI